MSQQRKGGLGRGLGALIPTSPEQSPSLGESAADVILGPRTGGPRTTPPRKRGTGSAAAGRGGEANSAADRAGGAGRPGARTDDATDAPELVDAGAVYREIAPSAIHPNPKQPRAVFDQEALDELTHSIREFGLLQPIVVREVAPGDYQLIMGERRWRASTAAGVQTIPAIVRQTEDEDLLRDALLENIHRVQLNPLEEAAAYQQLLEEFGVSQAQLAERIGRSRPAITNAIRLLQLSTPVQRRVAAGVLSAGHARALLALEGGPEAQDALAARIVAEGLSVRATEEIVTLANRECPATPARPGRRARERDPELDAVAGRLSDRFETSVAVTMGSRKGRITIDVGSREDLERVLRLLDGTSR